MPSFHPLFWVSKGIDIWKSCPRLAVVAENCRPVGVGGVGHLADQLILSQPGGADYVHRIMSPPICGPSYGPELWDAQRWCWLRLGAPAGYRDMVENHLPTRLKIIDPQEHSHEERCAIIDAHTLTTIPTTFVFLTIQLSVRFLENIWLTRKNEVRLQNWKKMLS